MAREMLSLRLDEGVLGRLKVRVAREIEAGHVKDRTEFLEELILAHLEGREPFVPRGPSAFPREDLEPGSSPEYPLQIAFLSPPPTPEP